MSRMLLNKDAVRNYILKTTKERRLGWTCTQVSPSVIDLLNAKLKRMIDRGVHQHPSIGKTFKELI